MMSNKDNTSTKMFEKCAQKVIQTRKGRTSQHPHIHTETAICIISDNARWHFRWIKQS